MRMEEDIEQRVIRAIADVTHTPREEVTPEKSFTELGLSSLDALAIVAELEEEFGVEIPNESAMSLSDVRQSVECIRTLLESKDESS